MGVADGDTITVLGAGNRQTRVRLQGIDAPESGQAFGQVSKQSLSDLVFDRQVVVEYEKNDRYGRTLGKVIIDGRDVNLVQVKAGLAWHYKYYQDDQSPEDRRLYAAAETEARGPDCGLIPARSRRGTSDAGSGREQKRAGRRRARAFRGQRQLPRRGGRQKGRRPGLQSRKARRSTSPAPGRSITGRVVNTYAAAGYQSL